MGSLHARVRNGGRKEMKAGCAADPDPAGLGDEWMLEGPSGHLQVEKMCEVTKQPLLAVLTAWEM